ncbi:uracil-DNA glycosylase [Methyloraptor flagellatus]|uniref:Type-5 uracil-DNA glycosylase n=1 Tax=Methyloraptor flagellatus TaxID=3162530 RepID=A0AAU7XGP0_9HYPH
MARSAKPAVAHAGIDTPADPGRDCPLCPRLVAFREEWRAREPGWFNAPVPSFRGDAPKLLVVGLAPGIRGANRTGRPFTGDYAGDLLYATMIDYGFARGTFQARPDDGLQLVDAAITNAVRCVPPENKPTPAEINTCRPFLVSTTASFDGLKAVLALGRIAHDSVVRAFGLVPSRVPFGHGAVHRLDGRPVLFDSYHCSRYNTNTGVLTTEMFRNVFAAIRAEIG